ncbi:hypothetical protein Yangon222_13690 [Helicobacter pylori]
MKNRYHESHIIRSIDKNGYTETDRMVEDYPKLKVEIAELKLKYEKSESENQKLRIENADQKQVNDLQQQLIESKNETIDALKRESDARGQLIEFLLKKEHYSTDESYRDERKEHSKSCLGFE